MDGQRVGARRVVVVIAVWVLATLVGLAVAATTKVGPVVLTLTHRHGVHLGDLLAFVVAYGAAGLISLWVITPRVARHPSR
ncbi:MAG: hypothetical protein ACRDQ0_00670 [Pseudonocardia sp.]